MKTLRLDVLVVAAVALVLAGCTGNPDAPTIAGVTDAEPADYLIGPGDELQIFVWGNPELSESVPVRPDGRISVPLIEDLPAANKTPSVLARDIEAILAEFVQNPIVTVIVRNFIGPFDQQVRVVGEAALPSAIPYRAKMTALDVMIAVGGLTEFAAGNDSVIVRSADGERAMYRVRLDDLLIDGDVSANVEMVPGDILIIPQSWF
jgi:polysaccharide export outer membrane protein